MSQINVADLTFGYEGSFDNVFEGVSFSVDTDWKLGLIGRNGQDHVFQASAGELPLHRNHHGVGSF